MLPFQVRSAYDLLFSIRVNVFSFHVACNHCSPICSLDHIYDTVTRDPLSCNMVKHLLTTGISVLPYLGISKPRKTPNLNRFYKRKRKNWAHLIKNWNDMFDNWSISTRNLLSSKKLWISKKIHTFSPFIKKKLPLLLNLTQFYIPSHNPNLKMNLYGKLHFFEK